MSKSSDNVDLRTVLRHTDRPQEANAQGDVERRLDALLNRRVDPEPVVPAPEPSDPLSRLRSRFADSFVAIVDELRGKYVANGVDLSLDAADFLGGGRQFTITIEFSGHGMRLEATVTDSIVAFSQTRFTASDRAGLTASGPSLRTRDLSANDFRNFVCERIALLVQSALKRL